ncbi:MAG TPA: hypothetical protein VG406_04385 [Isosphaeraceae bacterium]|nr:hypothetical protein [Isosphaeraceae bacterium]
MAEQRRKAGRPKVTVRREPIVGIKGVPEYKTWLDEFSEHCGLSLADTVGQALQHYAEHRGFRPPPKR